jgi:hypothetical protein
MHHIDPIYSIGDSVSKKKSTRSKRQLVRECLSEKIIEQLQARLARLEAGLVSTCNASTIDQASEIEIFIMPTNVSQIDDEEIQPLLSRQLISLHETY